MSSKEKQELTNKYHYGTSTNLQRVQTYPGHVFVVMKGNKIIDCVTITTEHASRPWFFGEAKK